MEWVELIVKDLLPTIIGIIGGTFGVIYWRENKALKAAEADKSKTEARKAEADLAESILEKYEKAILDRMDIGETVRKQEFSDLEGKIDSRFDEVNKENSKQNGLISDIVEYLNGDFQEFERKKHKKKKKKV